MKRPFILLLIVFASLAPLCAQKRLLKGKETNRVLPKLSVSYTETVAYSDGNGVWIEWKTEFERQNLGFEVFRIDGAGAEKVTSNLIPGAYLKYREASTQGDIYGFFDPNGTKDSKYTVSATSTSGSSQNTETVFVKSVKDLTPYAGATSYELAERMLRVRPVDEASDLKLDAELKSEVESYSRAADVNTHRWVVSQAGVRIGVSAKGFYRVSRAQLSAAGFDVNSDSSKWRLFANGNEVSINIVGANDAIEFFGEGEDTVDTATRVYYLILDTVNGKRFSSRFRRPTGISIPAKNYRETYSKRERTLYLSGLLNGAASNFYGTVINTTGANINFSLTAVDLSAETASFDFSIFGITQNPQSVTAQLNGTNIGTLSGFGTVSMRRTLDVPVSMLQEGTNTLRLVATAGTGTSVFDKLDLTFNRKFVSANDRLFYSTPNYKSATVTGFSSANVRTFDVTDFTNPVLTQNINASADTSGFMLYVPPARGRVFYSVGENGVMAPTYVTLNTPSALSNASNQANLVIVTHTNFRQQAEDWANFRRGQGTVVSVVDSEDVYDEFDFGRYGTAAITNFLSFAKNNWAIAPNYVLFIGDATYDPRNFIGMGVTSYIPTKMVDTLYLETGSDEAIADFNNDGLAELAVGRIPARTAQAVTDALAKTQLFEQNIAAWETRGAVFAYDLPNGWDFAAASQRLASQLPTTMPKSFVDRAATTAPTQLLTELNTGRYLINYSGHGNAGAWASTGFFSTAHANGLTNVTQPSFYMMLTCLNGYFFQSSDSLSEALLKNTNGGAGAVWSSTGLTTPDIQEIMGIRFIQQVTAGNITRVGDLIIDAKSTIPAGRDVRLSWCLLGDPMLKMR